MRQAQQNNFKINSQFFIQQLDALIVKITRTLAIEYGISPDPDAKEMVRKILLNRAHELMSDSSRSFASNMTKSVRDRIKSRQVNKYDKQIYELIKLLELENVKEC